MAYEALYRRYRPSRFQDAFFGQDHVVAALRNAIEGDRVGHAYLFSGPRGTGKTTSARILAKALNCTDLQGGEPCNVCDSCLAFQAGGSYDLHELDAASNNGVDAMRDLIGKVALGSPGRTKVYILDEVHMLSSGAENALLKTLEEPPPHVVFVLCTTEPNKVVPTIRSRTQHLEFSLLSASQVGELVDYIIGDAGIEITPDDRSYVIRAGGGSARDTLSALDQVVAAGGAPQGGEHLEALFQSLIERDAGAALAAIDGALQAGRDAASVGTSLLHGLRTVFLAAMRADVSHLPEAERELAVARAAGLSPARVTRAIEVIGTSIIEMRQAPDPRVDLEVAIMRLTRPDLDTDPAALVERLEAIEHQLASGAPITPAAAPASQVSPVDVAPAAAPASQVSPVDVAPAAAPASQVSPVDVAPAAAPASQVSPVDVAPVQAPASQAPAHHEEAASSPPAQPAPAQPAAAPQSGGRRGADMVRAELAKQGLSAGPAEAAQPARQTESTPAPTDAAAAPSGKTLADVRRERQAAAQAAGVPESDPNVEAAAAARRERQAAAQSGAHPAPVAEQPPTAGAPPLQSAIAAPVEAPVDAPPLQPVVQAPVDAHPAPVAEQPPTAGAPPLQPAIAAPVEAPVDAPPLQPVVQAPVEAPPDAPPLQPVVQAPVDAHPAPVAEQPPTAGAPLLQPVVQAPVEAPLAAPAQGEAPPPEMKPTAPAGGVLPTLAELEAMWQPLLESMSGRVRSRFSAGHFMETSSDSVMFGLPNPVHRDRCEEIRAEVDDALAARFGRPIPLSLVVDMVEEEPDFFATPPSGGAGVVTEAETAEHFGHEEDTVDVHDLVDATGDVPSAEDRVMATFENSELLEDPPNQHPNQ